MRRRLVLHIGTHKTGSTSIQKFLHGYRSKLALQGVFVPVAEPTPLGTQHRLFLTAAKGNEAAEAYVEGFVSDFSGSDCHTAVVSDENLELTYHMAEYFSAIADKLDCDLSVVAFVRPQVDYANSIVQQNCKNGKVTSAIDLVQQVMNQRRLRYGAHFDVWRESAEHVHCIPFNKAVKRLGVVQSFADSVGIDLGRDGLAGGKDIRENESISGASFVFLSTVRHYLEQLGFSPEEIVKFFLKYRTPLRAQFSSGEKFFCFDGRRIEGYRRYFEKTNANFARKFLNKQPWDEVFCEDLDDTAKRKKTFVEMDLLREIQEAAFKFVEQHAGGVGAEPGAAVRLA